MKSKLGCFAMNTNCSMIKHLSNVAEAVQLPICPFHFAYLWWLSTLSTKTYVVEHDPFCPLLRSYSHTDGYTQIQKMDKYAISFRIQSSIFSGRVTNSRLYVYVNICDDEN